MLVSTSSEDAEHFWVKLYFLTLPDPEFAIRRVERRVRFGGHDKMKMRQ